MCIAIAILNFQQVNNVGVSFLSGLNSQCMMLLMPHQRRLTNARSVHHPPVLVPVDHTPRPPHHRRPHRQTPRIHPGDQASPSGLYRRGGPDRPYIFAGVSLRLRRSWGLLVLRRGYIAGLRIPSRRTYKGARTPPQTLMPAYRATLTSCPVSVATNERSLHFCGFRLVKGFPIQGAYPGISVLIFFYVLLRRVGVLAGARRSPLAADQDIWQSS
jgi:hypothetical protein